jgi:translation initiation factor IF-2
MAERAADVIKSLMRMGVMATINQVIDADTAELIVTEFGHRLRRVAESDVEIGLRGEADDPETSEPRAPVVTIMGHVDHGKTSLLDALRETDVAAGEAGGITQHIGAYRVTLKNGKQITFIDTPGHQAFTAMRARGANVTDIVVLVVAADDGIMEQTVEAIRHARAAGVPVIVAINKMDRPDAKPDRVRQELLQHELVVEELGGEVLDVEVSALKKTNLDKLEEAILLQAELLDLSQSPVRPKEWCSSQAGARSRPGRRRGTLRVGDVFVAGEGGPSAALIDERGQALPDASPSTPVGVRGLNGMPRRHAISSWSGAARPGLPISGSADGATAARPRHPQADVFDRSGAARGCRCGQIRCPESLGRSSVRSKNCRPTKWRSRFCAGGRRDQQRRDLAKATGA